jgi:hypothetical protein
MAVVTATFQKCGSFKSWMSAIAGMLASARIPAATGLPALSKRHQQEKPQPQQQKRQQQQDLCGKAIKVAGMEPKIWL